MLRGLDVVVDECTVRAGYVKRWLMLAEDMGYRIRVVHIATPAEVCRQRRRDATPDFPLEVIDKKAALLADNLPAIRAMLAEDEYTVLA